MDIALDNGYMSFTIIVLNKVRYKSSVDLLDGLLYTELRGVKVDTYIQRK